MMGKMRGIKPETWTDDVFVEMSPLARLLYIGLWNFACDNGHVADRPRQIKMRVLPADDCNVSDLLDEAVALGRLTRADGWLTVLRLNQHQRVDKRWFKTCEKPGCCAPTTSSPPRAHVVPTTSTRRASPRPRDEVEVDVDCEVDGEVDGDGDGELKKAVGRDSKKSSPAKPVKDVPRQRGTRLPDGWTPTADLAEQMRAECPGVDLAREHRVFTDYWRAQPGQKGVKTDWPATWRNWMRRSQKDRRRPGSGPDWDAVYARAEARDRAEGLL